jgi:hypothetical protein
MLLSPCHEAGVPISPGNTPIPIGTITWKTKHKSPNLNDIVQPFSNHSRELKGLGSMERHVGLGFVEVFGYDSNYLDYIFRQYITK